MHESRIRAELASQPLTFSPPPLQSCIERIQSIDLEQVTMLTLRFTQSFRLLCVTGAYTYAWAYEYPRVDNLKKAQRVLLSSTVCEVSSRLPCPGLR